MNDVPPPPSRLTVAILAAPAVAALVVAVSALFTADNWWLGVIMVAAALGVSVDRLGKRWSARERLPTHRGRAWLRRVVAWLLPTIPLLPVAAIDKEMTLHEGVAAMSPVFLSLIAGFAAAYLVLDRAICWYARPRH